MKSIRLYHEKTDVIEIVDEIELDKDDIAKTLAPLFSQTKITILSTTNSTTVVRPSKLNAIVIEERDSVNQVPEPTEKTVVEVKPIEPEEDIITDVDA
jgi:hypothetical protein